MADGSDAARVELLRRLALEDAARKEQARRAKEEAAKEADPRESVQVFLDGFRASQEDIEASLPAGPAAAGSSSASSERLDQSAAAIASLEKRLADASYYLPAYEVRQASGAIAALKAKLEATRAPPADTKRFSFSRKAKVRPSGSAAAAAAAAAAAHSTQPCSSCSSSQAVADQAGGPVPSAPGPTSTSCSNGGGSGKRGCISAAPQVVVIGGSGAGAVVDEVIEDLSDCIIHLPHNVPALQLRRLRNCQLYAGAVTGATFISDVHDSIIMLASFQVRIHSSKGTDFYLRTKSNPIIEHCSSLRFAPYLPGAGPGKEVQLAFGEAANLWDQVDDFGWIKASASPNWEVLPQHARSAALD